MIANNFQFGGMTFPSQAASIGRNPCFINLRRFRGNEAGFHPFAAKNLYESATAGKSGRDLIAGPYANNRGAIARLR
jgi:hypothetical protein